MISTCDYKDCKSKYQDKLYNGKRVFTENKKGIAKCTVCGNPHPNFEK